MIKSRATSLIRRGLRAAEGESHETQADAPGRWQDRARRAAKGEAVNRMEAAKIAEDATADCVLARARCLRTTGHHALGLDLQRNAWRLGRSRGEMVALTFAASGDDEDFQRAIAAGDAARDAGGWAAAAGAYRSALELHPLHHGYRVQHGHMLKEQGLFEAAEIEYRDALALGAPPQDVLPHLAFVCRGEAAVVTAPDSPDGDPLNSAPSRPDVEAMAYLFWRDTHVSEADMLYLLRRCGTCAEVAKEMIADERFRFRNGPFLEWMRAAR